ncbi:MAG TPA: phage major capsid protein [Rhodoglobus sp.]|nr:phage major capsid protein [Rhodoglobus sp.]
MANPTTVSNSAATLLPPQITGPIFAKTAERSAVMSQARRVPLALVANTAIPVPMDIPVADWVGEAGVKPGAQVGVGVKTMQAKKLALMLPVSQEVADSNPGGLYDQLQQDLPTALSRAFDAAAVSGISLRTGGAGPFTDYIAQSPNTIALGATSQANGGIYADLVKAAGMVVDRNYEMNGWVADPRVRINAQLGTDTNGRPLLTDLHSTSTNGAELNNSLVGYPAAFNNGVSGRYVRAGDSLQTITITGTPTGGTFTLQSGGNTYVAAYSVATATLQAAIRAWGGIYAGVTVSGTAGTSYVVTFPAITANVFAASAPIQATSQLTGGSSPKVAVVASGAGGVDTTIRAVAGDWTQAAYGVGMDITIKRSTEASYFDGTNWHSAFQENLVLFLVEAAYGFVLGDPSAFAIVTKGSAQF